MTQTPNESTDVHADEVTTRPHQRTNRQYTPTACNAQNTTWRMEDSPTEVTQWLVELTQDAAGHTNVAWPHDDDGGLLSLQFRGDNLVWTRPRTLEVVAPSAS